MTLDIEPMDDSRTCGSSILFVGWPTHLRWSLSVAKASYQVGIVTWLFIGEIWSGNRFFGSKRRVYGHAHSKIVSQMIKSGQGLEEWLKYTILSIQ